jgi:hypothetical protein
MTEPKRYSCQMCPRNDLSLTANGRVRSHAANGKRASADNPACGGGSDFPKETVRTQALAGDPDARETMAHWDPPEVVAAGGNPMADADLGESDASGPGVPAGDEWDRPAPADAWDAEEPGRRPATGDAADAWDRSAGEPDTMAGGFPAAPEEPTAPGGAEELRPTATEYREAATVMRATGDIPYDVEAAAQDILDRAVSHGVRADDPDGDCTCPGKKKGAGDVHNAACPRYVPRLVTTHGGPNPNRKPIPTGGPGAMGPGEPVSGPARPAPHHVPAPPVKAGEAAEAEWEKASGIEPPASVAGPREAAALRKAVADEEANAFLGSGGVAGADEADAFLRGEQEEPEDALPPYFESRYDGTCSNCYERFTEGDEIRADGEGGWRGRECCGHEDEQEDAESAGDVPETEYDPLLMLRPKLPVKNGRYHGPNPSTGKKTTWSRVTTFVKLASDEYNLNGWQQRMAILGLVHKPELGRKVRTVLEEGAQEGLAPFELAKTRRDFLNGVVEDAKMAAGAKDRARKGTILHGHTEKIDGGIQDIADVPQEFRGDVSAYLGKAAEYGLESVPYLIERGTVVMELGVAGTFDRVYLITRDFSVTLPSGKLVELHAGDWVVGDVKTGADLSYAWPEIAIQVALYARGINTHGLATPVRVPGKGITWTWRRPGQSALDGTDWVVPAVREDVGLVMHAPYGEHTCTVHAVDLEAGWEGAQLCKQIQTRQKVKNFATVVSPASFTGAAVGAIVDKALTGAGYDRPTAAQLTTGHPSVTGAGTVLDRLSPEQREDLATATGARVPRHVHRFEYADDGNGNSGSFCTVDDCGEPEPQDPATAAESGAPARTIRPGDRHYGGTTSQEAAAGMQNLAATAKAAGSTVAQGTGKPVWKDRFDVMMTKDDLRELVRSARAAGMPEDVLNKYIRLALNRQFNSAMAEPGRRPQRPAPAAAPAPRPAAVPPQERPAPTWKARFDAAATMDELLDQCRQAQASGMPREKINGFYENAKHRLATAAAVRQAPPAPAAEPTWEQRFRALTTTEQARAAVAAARAAGMPETRLAALIAIGKEALAEPPF